MATLHIQAEYRHLTMRTELMRTRALETYIRHTVTSMAVQEVMIDQVAEIIQLRVIC